MMDFRGQAPAASARPDIISLDILLKDVDDGRVQIPRFQRPYVWTPLMMRELFDSVLNGYPIGSLLFWEPRDTNVKVMDRIGPISAPTQSAPASLVLDGHQRLATLYGVLRLDSPTAAAPADERWWIGYDLISEEARQMKYPEDFDNPRVLPLRIVLRTAEFIRFARLVDDSSLPGNEKVTLLDRADAVQRAIRDYRIALTIMRDGDVNDAVGIFSRINRSGRPMTTDQMAVALTYHEDFDLEVALDDILGALEPYGFGDVSRTVVLQSLLHAAGKNYVKPNFDNLREKETRDRLKSAVSEVTQSLVLASKFLNDEIGFSTSRLLPYSLQIMLLGVFFRENGSTEELEKERFVFSLKRWFWATSFEGWFASANTSDVENAVAFMEAFARSSAGSTATASFESFFVDRPLRPFPKTFDRRSARIRAMLLVQMAAGPLVDPLRGDLINGSDLMADADRRDLPYVFRPARNRSARSPANRLLLDRRYGSAVRDVLSEGHANHSAMATHGIDSAALSAILAKDVDAFVSAREAALSRMEGEFLAQFNLRLDAAVGRAEVEIDTGDV
ncbi:DUF262 domain-containing protein [Brevundimonas naejangsanensis]|uniref:DUF262 domain-containing protein n=1 Tax=Brevundimonas naejangsanensis TaxID=588932 RepID=UPI0026EC61E7|nr:DUF262 domain-containing protein [Brevundimonas naejangsanensis]